MSNPGAGRKKPKRCVFLAWAEIAGYRTKGGFNYDMSTGMPYLTSTRSAWIAGAKLTRVRVTITPIVVKSKRER